MNKQISIILPSYNDIRIVQAIQSVRRFDDIGTVRIIIVDGGSSVDVLDLIEGLLGPEDVFLTEKDDGIFDALNKGLQLCDTPYIGWLGSDDEFTGHVMAGEVVSALSDYDLFVAGCAICLGERVRRIYHSSPSRFGLVKFGLHNPHFSTFGRAGLLKSEKFELGILGSDIAYFVRIFAQKPRVASSGMIATIMSEGGYSTESYWKVLRTNYELIAVYRRYTNVFAAPIAVLIKLGYKSCSLFYYKLFKKSRSEIEQESCV